MKVAVFGANGMLGRAVTRALAAADYAPIIPFSRSECDISSKFEVSLRWQEHRWDAAINCAGALPGDPEWQMGLANTAGPLVLADAAIRHKFRLIHVSTDCVFGQFNEKIAYTERAVPIPDGRYGKTKLAGEPSGYKDSGGGNILTVRCSFIGHEAGLMRWLFDMNREGQAVKGWKNAYWNGSTVDIVAEYLVRLLPDKAVGLVHMASAARYSKYDVLCAIAHAFSLQVTIEPVEEPIVWRVLEPSILLPPFIEGLLTTARRMREEHDVNVT